MEQENAVYGLRSGREGPWAFCTSWHALRLGGQGLAPDSPPPNPTLLRPAATTPAGQCTDAALTDATARLQERLAVSIDVAWDRTTFMGLWPNIRAGPDWLCMGRT